MKIYPKRNYVKYILLFTLVLTSFSPFAQTTRESLAKKKISGITVEMIKSTDPSREDLVLVFLTYQNQKYSTISDVASIMLTDSTDLRKFNSDLQACYDYMNSGEKGKSIIYEHKRYRLEIFDFSKNLYINDETGRKYIAVDKKTLETLIEFMKTLEYP